MKILILTAKAAPESAVSRVAQLAQSLREQGSEVTVASESLGASLDEVDFLFRSYPGGDINPGLLSETQDYVEAFRRLLGGIDPARVVLLETPRGPESLVIANALGLAATIDEHDLWVALTAGIGEKPYQSGIGGRADVLRAIGANLEYERGAYGKTAVAPFASLGELLTRYLTALP